MVFYPNTAQEREFWGQGLQYIAGIDEAGRGAWAGPLVVAAVILSPDGIIRGLKDSKLLSPAAREKLEPQIKKEALAFRVEIASAQDVDRMGILSATKALMRLALQSLRPSPHAAIIDAVKLTGLTFPVRAIIGADRKVASVAAASILAKVERDRLLRELAKKFPHYDFATHKGYGTRLHHERLIKYGPCTAHRLSYRPVYDILAKANEQDLLEAKG